MAEPTTSTDVDALKAAPAASVVEVAAPIGGTTIYAIYHWASGAPDGLSYARGDEISDWIADLHRAGRAVAYGWELRGEPAPEGFPC